MPAAAPTTHATAIIVGTTGILVRGRSGGGKSTLAHELLASAASAGRFAAFVADDRVELVAAGGRLVARAPVSIAGLAELYGRGILSVPHEPAAVIALVVDLLPPDEIPRMPDEADGKTVLEGVPVARIAAPERSLDVGRLLVAAALVERI